MPVVAIRFTILSLLIFVISLAAYSQPRASKDGIRPSANKGSVAGTVAAPGLTNVSGIRITLHNTSGSAADPSQTTGPDGSFVFYDIPAGTYALDIDPATLPQKYSHTAAAMIEVKPGLRSETQMKLNARRSIVGHAFTDVNGNGIYSPSKDTPVAGAQIAVGGRFVVSGPDGSFRLDELPSGRISLTVTWPGHDHTTHVVLDLGDGPVTDRSVNVPLYR